MNLGPQAKRDITGGIIILLLISLIILFIKINDFEIKKKGDTPITIPLIGPKW